MNLDDEQEKLLHGKEGGIYGGHDDFQGAKGHL